VDTVTLGSFLGSTGRMTIPVVSIIDNEEGTVSFGVVSVGSASGPSGTGELIAVSLTAEGSGISPLDLQNVMVMDIYAESQETTVEDGTAMVGGAETPTPTSTPTQTTTPTSTPTSTATPEPSTREIYLPLVATRW
jgi:hypothetical protein